MASAGRRPDLSWERLLFQFARWPWALLGSVAAVRDWLTGSSVDFRITPKGTSEVDPLPARVLLPYALLSLVSVLPVLAIGDAGAAGGFYIFAIVNALLYALLFLVIVVQHVRENVVRGWRPHYRPALAGQPGGAVPAARAGRCRAWACRRRVARLRGRPAAADRIPLRRVGRRPERHPAAQRAFQSALDPAGPRPAES